MRANHHPSPPTRHPARPRTAQELEAYARGCPERSEDRAESLIEAAGEWAAAGDHARALAIYDELLAAGCDDPEEMAAFRISALWETGSEALAREAASRLRAGHPHSPDAWNIVAETFEAQGDLRNAADWFTAGIAHVLGPAPTRAAASTPAHQQLFIGRHRVRRLLGSGHDDWDDLADVLYAATPFALRGGRTLDEAHAPARLRAIDAHDPAAMHRELDHATAQFTPRSDPPPDALPYWPAPEYARLLHRWPALADSLGADPESHRLGIELACRAMHEAGETRLRVSPMTAAAYGSYAHSVGEPPDSPPTAYAYANALAGHARSLHWPPQSNAPCWCGSGRKYKRCCGTEEIT